MKAGTKVTFKHSTLGGEVITRRINSDDEMEYLVKFNDKDGVEQQRWTLGSDLEVVK